MHRLRDRMGLVMCALGALLGAVWFREMRHDDAFITFQYARSIATGAGFVFNPDERVLGTTTPLFTLLMAAAYPLFRDGIAQLAIVLSACALGVQAFVIHRWLRDTHPMTALALCACVLLGLADSETYFALETNLVVALGFAGIEVFRAGYAKTAGVLLGLAFLTRYDASLFGLVVLALGRTEFRRRVLPTALVAVAVALPWLIFATAYFGSPLPHTLGAKRGSTPFLAYLKASLSWSLEFPGLQNVATALRLPPALLALAASVLFWFRRGHVLLWIIGHGALLMLVYAFLGPPKGQTWHLYASFLIFRVSIVAAALGWLEEHYERRWARGALLGVAGALGAFLFWRLQRFSNEHLSEFWLGQRHRRYQAVADYVRQQLPPGQAFMSSEVGTLGYLTGARMIDPYGLINPTNDWPRTFRSEAYAELVLRYRPSVILLDSPEAAHTLAQQAPNLSYRIVKIFDWREPWSTLAVRER